jgi:acyl carrier protein
MSNLDDRLIECFRAVLPNIHPDDMRTVTMRSAPGWDSVVTITLISLIEESFGVETQPDDIEHLTSFETIRAYLLRKAGAPN